MPEPIVLTGGCQCGAIRYRIDKPVLALLRCHCTDCQAQSASAFGMSLYVPFEGITLTGQTEEYVGTADSGRRMRRAFCPTCGTRVIHLKDPDPEFVSVKAGSLDPGHGLSPIADVWTRSKLDWIPLIPDGLSYDRQPDTFDDIIATWQERRATLAYYNAEAPTYAKWSRPPSPTQWLERFASALPPGGHVLDLGCGGGWAAAWFRDQGFEISAIDGSRGLAEAAKQEFGLDVRVARFEVLDAHDIYDGVWAHFSLLHAPRRDMPDHLRRIADALKAGGRVLLGLKGGEGAYTDSLGRYYTLYSTEEIEHLLKAAGFRDIAVRVKEGLPGYDGRIDPSLFVTATYHG